MKQCLLCDNPAGGPASKYCAQCRREIRQRVSRENGKLTANKIPSDIQKRIRVARQVKEQMARAGAVGGQQETQQWVREFCKAVGDG